MRLVLFGIYSWTVFNTIDVFANDTTCGEEYYCVGSGMQNPIPDSKCVDLHSLCREWADTGECLLNPKYMKAACKYSCLLCLKEESRKIEGLDQVRM